MQRQHNANTTFRHIPTEYDSCGLGRDDPVWPRYVAEATKWDAQLVEGWHKGMDVILLVQRLGLNSFRGTILGDRDSTETVDIAVQAISSTILKTKIHNYLQDSGSLVTLLAQKFTAIFNGALDGENYDPNTVTVNSTQLKDAALYGRALVNITRYIQIQPVTYSGIHDQGYITRNVRGSGSPKKATKITLMRDQVTAVERGLFLVASSKEPAIACSGVTCLSAWYTSTDRAAQSRDKWKKMLARLIGLLSNNNHRERLRSESMAQSSILETPMRHQSVQVEGHEAAVREDRYTSTKALESDELDRIVHALLLELAHWRWDLSKQERLDILIPLIGLFTPPLDFLSGPSRPGMSAILAILALLFNDHQGLLNETDVDWVNLQNLGPEGDRDPDPIEEADLKDTQLSTSQRRSIWAQCAVRICLEDDEYMLEYANPLLFFGLAGLLDSFSALGLAELAPNIAELVTTQLNAMSGAFRSGPITLPRILPDTVDTRVFMADAITRSLSPSPFKGQRPFSEVQKAELLKCLWDKSYIWSDYGHQFLMPIVQLLHAAQIMELRSQCLTALNEYLFANRNPSEHSGPYHGVDWRFFFSLDVPYRLAEIMKENKELRSKAIATFDSIMKMIPKHSPNPEIVVKDQISPLMSRLAVNGLLSAFAEVALCRNVYDYPYVQKWRDELMNLPEWLDSAGASNAESVKAGLRQFYAENIRRPDLVPAMTILTLGVGGKLNLDEESLQPHHRTPSS
ncbi:NACHT, LRR and PYD domains-containing protein 9 [Rhizoctonia solani]|uniref:NACHT, LRR and PYD domains-containing protein 9 n=1 Tax=Rhizoctonia solani TaxID=456999 RepID=A0A0K6G7A1_9AGAM|nr:NACHT, LRR and PYD domains-containing protein 9 [Rhizoctonia solani]